MLNKHIVHILLILYTISSCTNKNFKDFTYKKKSALLLYMIADNNLDYYAVQNINELEQGVYSTFGTNQSIYVYIDRTKDREKPLLYQVVADTLPLIRSKIEYAYPEVNSADPNEFKNILNDIILLTKSRNEKLRGLILWSHGSSWLPIGNRLTSLRGEIDVNKSKLMRTFGLDKNTCSKGDSEMSILDLSNALKGNNFEYLIFGACLMGSIEVAYELKNNFEYIIASPTEILASGFPYKDIIPLLGKDEIDYKSICDTYVNNYESKKGILKSASISLIKTRHLELLSEALKPFITKKTLKKAFENSIQYELSHSDILFDINSIIDEIEDNKTRKKLSNILEDIIIYHKHTKYFFHTIPLSKTGGLNIFIPNKFIKNESVEFQFYRKLSWAKDTGLSNFNITN